MLHARPTLTAKRALLTAFVIATLAAACDLDHEGGVDLDGEATGGIFSTGGQATAGVGAILSTGGLAPTGGGGFEATGGLGTGGAEPATGGIETGGFATGGTGTGETSTGGEPNAPECPTTAPTDSSSCTRNFGAPLACNYETLACTCYGFGMAAQWTCQSATCPANVPWGDELLCAGAEGTTCPYGSIECVCESGYWNCG